MGIKRLVVLLVALTSSWMAAGASQSQPSGFVVLELYTSQGCSSCPPADDFLAELASAEPGDLTFMSRNSASLLPLGFHVDYWDYLGWKDEMADPAFTRRQRDYARSRGEPMIYTPQMIVQGQAFLVGSKRSAIKDAINRYGVASPVAVNAQDIPSSGGHRGWAIKIDPQANSALAGNGVMDVIYLRYLDDERDVYVGAGENRNRRISYANVVTDLRYLGKWDAQRTFSHRISGLSDESAGTEQELILLQMAGFGRIVGANFLK